MESPAGSDVLLATKLHVPRPQPGFVPRPRLPQALADGLARGRVLVSSRADPPLPLARLRARGQLAELRAADLRFIPEEAGALLGEAASRYATVRACAWPRAGQTSKSPTIWWWRSTRSRSM